MSPFLLERTGDSRPQVRRAPRKDALGGKESQAPEADALTWGQPARVLHCLSAPGCSGARGAAAAGRLAQWLLRQPRLVSGPSELGLRGADALRYREHQLSVNT